MKDLIVLVADKNMEFTIRGGLGRNKSLGIRLVGFDVVQHPGRDGGARSSGAQILALEKSRYSHALLLLDHEGSGTELSPEELERSLDAQLSSHWGESGKAIVISPELDIWMWGNDNHLAEVLRWPQTGSIRDWLSERGFAFHPNGKPVRPKEALEAIFPVCRLPRSSANYQKVASSISLARCADPAFQRLRAKLQEWFPTTD